MSRSNQHRPFGFRDKLGYLFGDFGNDFTFVFSTSILLKFYTDVMGISAAVVGTVMMIARFVDSVTDITMGRICDRSRQTRAGKFKPWILRMCGPVALSSFLIYQSRLSDMSMPFKIGYLFVTYILWGSVFYTSINIPYGSMASAISARPDERQSLSTFRSMGGMLAGLIIGVGIPMFAYERIDGKEVLVGDRVTLLAAIFSILAIVCYILCYYLCTERIRPDVSEDVFKDHSIGRMFSNAIKNRALISIIAASVVMLLAQLTMQTVSNYIFPDYYNNADAQSLSTVLMVIAMSAAALVAKPLAKRFGKAELGSAASLFAAAISAFLFFLRPQSVWVYCAFQFLLWLGLGFFSMVNWSLITDVIDHSEIKNGIREDGSIYAIYSFARKLGQALAAGLTGFLLELIGYNTSAATEGALQSSLVLEGIFNISVIVPAIGFLLLGIILWVWYPLHKKQVEKNVAFLAEKHGRKS